MKSCFQNLILRRKKSNFWIEKKIKKRGWSPVFALLKLCTISVCPKEPLAETRKVEWKESSSREREPAKENSENTLLCSVASSLSLSPFSFQDEYHEILPRVVSITLTLIIHYIHAFTFINTIYASCFYFTQN